MVLYVKLTINHHWFRWWLGAVTTAVGKDAYVVSRRKFQAGKIISVPTDALVPGAVDNCVYCDVIHAT